MPEAKINARPPAPAWKTVRLANGKTIQVAVVPAAAARRTHG